MVARQEWSNAQYARVAGFLYLMIIALGIYGQFGIKDSMITADEASTYQNIVTGEWLWRSGIIIDLIMQILDVPVMVIMYLLLKRTDKNLALMGLLFNMIQTVILVANKMVILTPVILINSSTYLQSFSLSQIHTQVYLLTDLHDYGLGIGLIFFGLSCLVYGYLIFHSTYFPNILGIMMATAGMAYLVNSVTLILAPQYSEYVFYVLVFSFIGELSFSLWLLIKGIKKSASPASIAKG